MKWLIYLGLGYLAYSFYKNYAATQLTATGLPAGASLAQSFNVLGMTANVYIAQNGYYLQLVSNGVVAKTLGPYSQQQVATALDVQNAITQGIGNL